MNFRKTLARAVALALLAGPVSVAVLSETDAAHASATLTTTTTLDPVTTVAEYKQSVFLTGSVKDSTGASVYDGTVTLMAAAYPYTSWVPVQSTSAGGYVSFTVNPTISTEYQLVYSGATATSSYDDNYTGSQSSQVGAPVARKVTIKHSGLHMWGKVTPAAKTKLVFKVKKGKKYKNWFKVKTNKKGKWSKHVRGRVGTKFEIVLPTSGGYVGRVNKYTIIGF